MYYVLTIKRGGRGSWKLASEERTLKQARLYAKLYMSHYPYRKTKIVKSIGK